MFVMLCIENFFVNIHPYKDPVHLRNVHPTFAHIIKYVSQEYVLMKLSKKLKLVHVSKKVEMPALIRQKIEIYFCTVGYMSWEKNRTMYSVQTRVFRSN